MTHPATIPSDVRQPIVSFVIPALNEERFIRRCLESISQLTLPAGVSGVEVIVVDNESTDRTAEICRELGAKVISTPPGRASRARNHGASIANGKWVAFIDADCEAPHDWLVHCIAPFSDPRVVAVGGRVLPPADSSSWVAHTIGALGGEGGSSPTRDAPWLTTQGLLVRHSAFTDVGGFDESLITCEDCDLSYKLRESGRLVFVPAAELVHHGESTKLLELFRREAWRSRDNLRLSLSRPGDLRNWISLLLPVVFLGLTVVGVVGLVGSLASGNSTGLWATLLAMGAIMPPVYALAKSRGLVGPLRLAQRSAVLATYFLGRAAGLLWSFPRVSR